jgi:hypothetical protein
MKNVALHGPGSESFGLDPPLNSDRYILMPRYFPVCVWNLIEKNPPHGLALSSKYRLNQTAHDWRAGKLPHLRGLFEQIANREDTNLLSDASLLLDLVDGGPEFFDFGCRNNGLTRGEAVLLDLFAKK